VSTSLDPSSYRAYVPPVSAGPNAGKFIVQMGGSTIFGTAHTYAAGSWYHVEYTWDGTTQTIYVNGMADATGSAIATSATPSWGGTTYLGADPLVSTSPAPSASEVETHYLAASILPSATPTPVPTSVP
jgi:hypothetical protein